MNQTNWPFYFALENDILKISRYIEINVNNYNVYSIELLRLYLSICSEIDVVLKQVCTKLDKDTKTNNIFDYRQLILEKLSCFPNEIVVCSRFNLSFHPWEAWLKNESPTWWKSYNQVKHNRDEFYQEATLKNVLEAMSALYLANMFVVFLERKELNPEFYFTVSDAVKGSPIQNDFYRLSDMMAYISEI